MHRLFVNLWTLQSRRSQEIVENDCDANIISSLLYLSFREEMQLVSNNALRLAGIRRGGSVGDQRDSGIPPSEDLILISVFGKDHEEGKKTEPPASKKNASRKPFEDSGTSDDGKEAGSKNKPVVERISLTQSLIQSLSLRLEVMHYVNALANTISRTVIIENAEFLRTCDISESIVPLCERLLIPMCNVILESISLVPQLLCVGAWKIQQCCEDFDGLYTLNSDLMERVHQDTHTLSGSKYVTLLNPGHFLGECILPRLFRWITGQYSVEDVGESQLTKACLILSEKATLSEESAAAEDVIQNKSVGLQLSDLDPQVSMNSVHDSASNASAPGMLLLLAQQLLHDAFQCSTKKLNQRDNKENNASLLSLAEVAALSKAKDMISRFVNKTSLPFYR